MPCDYLLGKGWPLGSRLWCLIMTLSLSHWYPRSGVVLDCIDSWSWHSFYHTCIHVCFYLQCNAGLATYKMFEYLQAPPTKLMLLGCLCSTESEATAQVSHLFNITQVRMRCWTVHTLSLSRVANRANTVSTCLRNLTDTFNGNTIKSTCIVATCLVWVCVGDNNIPWS